MNLSHLSGKRSITALCLISSIFAVSDTFAIPTNSAIAESILNVTNFKFRKTNSDALTISDLAIVSSGDTTSKLDSAAISINSPSSTDGITGFQAGFQFDLKSYVDPSVACTTFSCADLNFANPLVPDATNFTKSYAAGASQSTGDSLDPVNSPNGDTVVINSTVVLAGTGAGLTNSSQYLTGVKFRAAGDQDVRLSFDAAGFLNAQLGQDPSIDNFEQGASASYNWSLTLERSNSSNGPYSTVFSWAPDGRAFNPCFGITLGVCSNVQEGFNLNYGLSASNSEDGLSLINDESHFNLEVNLVNNKYYKLGLRHVQNASASFVATPIPEPAMFSLLSIGFLGLAGTVKKVGKNCGKLNHQQRQQNVI